MRFDPKNPRHAAILAVREDTEARRSALANQGVQLQINGRESAVLEYLLDWMAGTCDERLDFEQEWADQVAAMVTEAEREVRNQRLTAGVALNPRVVQQVQRNQ